MGNDPKSAAQLQRFKEAAHELGADRVSEKRFDTALRKVGSAPPAPVHKPKKKVKGKAQRKAG